MNPGLMVTKRLREYEYFAPPTIEEAVSLLERHGERAAVLAGGTDVLPLMKLGTLRRACVLNLKRVTGLEFIREEGGELKIGALTKMASIRASELIARECESLFEAVKLFATPQVRNMATVGGNICRSSPCADTVPPLMTFDARLTLVGPRGERRVRLEEFFLGGGRNLLDREILTEIVVPLRRQRCASAFAKAMRNSADLAKVNCAVRMTVSGKRCEDVRIVVGAVADKPVRAATAEAMMRGRDLTEELIEEAARSVVEDIAPISDVRSTSAYRKHVSEILVKRLATETYRRLAQ